MGIKVANQLDFKKRRLLWAHLAGPKVITRKLKGRRGRPNKKARESDVITEARSVILLALKTVKGEHRPKMGGLGMN